MLGAVAQLAEILQLHPRRSSEGRFLAQDAVELRGMADGLVDLQRHLATVDDEVACAGLDVWCSEECCGLLRDTRSVADEIEAQHVLPARLRPSAAVAVGV